MNTIFFSTADITIFLFNPRYFTKNPTPACPGTHIFLNFALYLSKSLTRVAKLKAKNKKRIKRPGENRPEN